jgi:PAS domain S-box-containing protein
LERLTVDSAGKLKWVNTHKAPIRDRNGNIVGILGISHDITARKQAIDELEIKTIQLENLFNNLDEAFFSIDLIGYQVLQVSPACDEVLGVSAAAFRANPMLWRGLFPESDSNPGADVETQLYTGRPVVTERWITRPDGIQRYITLKINPVLDTSGRLIRVDGVGTDITQRKQAEDALRTAQQAEHEQRVLAESLRDVASSLTSTLDPSLVMTHILEHLGRVVPHDAANIMLVEGHKARIVSSHGYPDSMTPVIENYLFSIDTLPNLKRMLYDGLPSLVPDVANDPDWVIIDSISHEWSRSYLGTPIRAHGLVIGFLNLASITPNYFKESHKAPLQMFADQAAIALENAQLYDQVRVRSMQLEVRVRERTAELHRAKEHVETILNNSSDAIFVVQLNGAIMSKNPAFSRLFMYDADDTSVKWLETLFSADEIEPLYYALIAIAQGDSSSVRLELVAQRRDGTQFHADIALSGIADEDGHVTDMICSVRDISARRQMEMGLRETLEREKELGELKNRLIAMISHNFRTPLAVILSSTGLLEAHIVRQETQETIARWSKYLNKISISVTQMTRIIEDVLMYTNQESTTLAARPTRIDLDEFFRTLVAESQKNDLDSHLITFSSDGDCHSVFLDPNLLRQIFTNLLSNALKFSPNDSQVTITLRCLSTQMIIKFQDTGIGIPKEDQDHLFKPFHRGKNVGTIPGSGLGLANIKKLIEAQQGTITVESTVDVGTTVTVTLPPAELDQR